MSMTMETRPFSIQSPEAIAKEYGGNKQKIAQAMQMGIIDPTAGMLAGMFIDRMRAAAQQEQAPQQTIAQQVFAPPAAPQQMSELDTTLQAAFGPPPRRGGEALPPAPAGLGATPEAAQMMAPPPMEQPMGMAEGGMVPPYMNNGGLAELPVPDGMFDEPHNGSYAGGGIVAFADSGLVKAKTSEDDDEDMLESTAPRPKKPQSLGALPSFDIPRSIFGMSGDVMTNMDRLKETYTPQTKQMDRATKAYEEELTPEGLKKRRDEDFGAFLMKFGAKLASTPGDLVTAAGIAGGEALPGLEAASKERRADQRQMLKNLQENEGLSNKEAKEARNLALDMQIKYGSLAVALQDTAFKNLWQLMDDNTKRYIAKLSNEASKYGSDRQYDASVVGLNRENARITQLAVKSVDDKIAEGGELQPEYLNAPNKAAYRQQKIAEEVAALGGYLGGGGGGKGDYGTPPPGAVTRTK
jgi:hypothetical protein